MKLVSLKTRVIMAIVGAIIVSVSIMLLQPVLTESQDVQVQKAAIIDQLDSEIPNKYFQSKATEYLTGAGYKVDLYTTENVTIDFYKKLPSLNYKFIVVRSHAAVDESEDKSVILFSGEKYTTDKYITEQLFGQVKKATPLLEQNFQVNVTKSSEWVQINETARSITISNEWKLVESKEEYFAVPGKFVVDLMVGKFPSSTIVLGGCNTLTNPSMAQALVNRGASSVIGWSDFVGSADNDRLTLKVLEKILVENMNGKDAVESVMENYKTSPKYPSSLEYFSQ